MISNIEVSNRPMEINVKNHNDFNLDWIIKKGYFIGTTIDFIKATITSHLTIVFSFFSFSVCCVFCFLSFSFNRSFVQQKSSF